MDKQQLFEEALERINSHAEEDNEFLRRMIEKGESVYSPPNVLNEELLK